MTTQYSEIAEKYADSQDRRLLRVYIADPSLFDVIGDVSGLEVLDLACGDGRLSRQLRLRGAKSVLGIDAEPKMIQLAREREAESGGAIEYRVGRVGELGIVGNFDLAVPGFLLHYAETREELFRMCEDIYKNLKEGGRMVGINQNPDCPRNPHSRYGSTAEPIQEPPVEGGLVKITLWDGDSQICAPFFNYHWNKSTYEHALALAGFKDVKWNPMYVSEKGKEQFGEEFWQDWLNQQSLVVIEARK
jgi:SAM-dependent methyltransferase